MPNQADPEAGCIPACAIGILAWKGHAAPTEDALLQAMYGTQAGGSGFDRLKVALAPSGILVQVERPRSLAERITALCSAGHPVMVAVNGGAGAHCVVVESVSGGDAVVHDPDPGLVNPQTVSLAALAGRACGDLAFLP
ncbi:MAG: hypothetical protein KF718_02430 [Polyangiaceae bacterium]|nr:hypothetical protein [Polyangiaceae bacterium]